jgi:hypothetical protein
MKRYGQRENRTKAHPFMSLHSTALIASRFISIGRVKTIGGIGLKQYPEKRIEVRGGGSCLNGNQGIDLVEW